MTMGIWGGVSYVVAWHRVIVVGPAAPVDPVWERFGGLELD